MNEGCGPVWLLSAVSPGLGIVTLIFAVFESNGMKLSLWE